MALPVTMYIHIIHTNIHIIYYMATWRYLLRFALTICAHLSAFLLSPLAPGNDVIPKGAHKHTHALSCILLQWLTIGTRQQRSTQRCTQAHPHTLLHTLAMTHHWHPATTFHTIMLPPFSVMASLLSSGEKAQASGLDMTAASRDMSSVPWSTYHMETCAGLGVWCITCVYVCVNSCVHVHVCLGVCVCMFVCLCPFIYMCLSCTHASVYLIVRIIVFKLKHTH